MSFLIGEIVANVRADSSQFRSEMRNVERQGDQSSRNVQRSMGGIGNKFTRLAFLARTLFASTIVVGARRAVNEFAQLEGALAKFDVVFAEQAAEMRGWVDQFRRGVPLARREIVAAAASMQDLLVPMGIARDQATDMTREWLELAAALAAFNDVPVDQALEAIRSGIAGQSRPLRQFGIDVRETALQQTALAEGLMRSGEEMTEQVRQQALLLQAYRQSTDAIDGYEDQLDSTLIREQALGAQFKDTAAILGQILQPAYNKFVESAGAAMRRFTRDISAIGVSLTEIESGLERAFMGEDDIDGVRATMIELQDAIRRTSETVAGGGPLALMYADRLERLGVSAQQLQVILDNLEAGENPFEETVGDVEALPPTVRELKDEIDKLNDAIDNSFDPREIQQYQREIQELEQRIAGLMGELRPEIGVERPVVDLDQALKDVDETLEGIIGKPDMDFSEFFDIGTIGRMREEIQELEHDLIRTTDPEKVLLLQAQIDELNERIREMRNDTSESTGAAQFFTRTFADGLERVLFRANSVRDALEGIARQLASRALITGLGMLFGAPMAGGFMGAMFGGFRSSGGSVQPGRAYRFNENNQEELFIPHTGGSIVNPQVSSGGISPADMERAFLSALDRKLSKLSAGEIYTLAERGRFEF